MQQIFNGESYWLCGHYYQRHGKRLHREVWQHHNGPIPKGFHVHHRDGDRTNNDISNLELLRAGEHMRHHASDPVHLPRQRAHIERIRPLAAAWHSSPEGLEWHSQHSARVQANLKPVHPWTCCVCGKSGMSKKPNRRFCSGACYQKDFRRRNPGYYAKLAASRRVQPPRSGTE